MIGTTGLFDDDFAEIDAQARAAGVGVATGNFSLTAALLQHLARIAARHVPSFEVIEHGAAAKPDVPSGTARELAEVLSRERGRAGRRYRAADGTREARGAPIGGVRRRDPADGRARASRSCSAHRASGSRSVTTSGPTPPSSSRALLAARHLRADPCRAGARPAPLRQPGRGTLSSLTSNSRAASHPVRRD